MPSTLNSSSRRFYQVYEIVHGHGDNGHYTILESKIFIHFDQPLTVVHILHSFTVLPLACARAQAALISKQLGVHGLA